MICHIEVQMSSINFPNHKKQPAKHQHQEIAPISNAVLLDSTTCGVNDFI